MRQLRGHFCDICIGSQRGLAISSISMQGVKLIAGTAIEYAQGWRGHRDVKQKLSPPNLVMVDS
jgi:hypothetical protein